MRWSRVDSSEKLRAKYNLCVCVHIHIYKYIYINTSTLEKEEEKSLSDLIALW